MAERLYTTYQVADLLGATPSAVVDWMQKGWLAFERSPDGPVRIPEKGLISFLKQQGIDFEALMAKEILRYEHAKSTEQNPQPPAEGNPKEQPMLPSETGNSPSEPQTEPEAAESTESPDRKETPAAASQESVEPPPSEPAPEAAAPSEPAPEAAAPGEPALAEQGPIDPAEQVARAICRDAVERRATHVHLEQRGKELSLRLRIDGVLHEKASFAARLPATVAPRLIEQFKAIAAPETDQALPSFTHTIEGRSVTFHLHSLQTTGGEKIVLDVRDELLAPADISRFDFTDQQEQMLRRLIAQPCGLIIFTGPPRTGRDELLWAMVGELNRTQLSVGCLARAPRIEIDGITHYPIDPQASAETITSLAEADTDVIIIAEPNDEPSVLAAIDSAARGRLVLMGLAANTPIDALGQILSTHPAPYPLGSRLLGVLAPRTLRKLCDDCKVDAEASDELLAQVRLQRSQLTSTARSAVGCEKCAKTGYAGITCALSVLEMTEPIAAMLRRNEAREAIERTAVEVGVKSPREAMLEKINAGVTSLEELARVFPL